MRLDQVIDYTAADIERMLDRMEIRRSATGKLHLFRDDRNPGGHPNAVVMTFCGLTEDQLESEAVYRRAARDWGAPLSVRQSQRCARCRLSWQRRLEIAV